MRLNRIKLTVALMQKDMTLTELANQSGLSKSTVTSVKSGKSCSTQTAEAIANVLGVSLGDLREVKCNG